MQWILRPTSSTSSTSSSKVKKKMQVFGLQLLWGASDYWTGPPPFLFPYFYFSAWFFSSSSLVFLYLGFLLGRQM